MKLWIDDVRQAPEGYVWCMTTNEAKMVIACVVRLGSLFHTENVPEIELIDIDHDAGEYAKFGGDYIKILDWLEESELGEYFPINIRIHSMNPVGVENMRRIVQRNGWNEIK